jgi:hypothetical protein
MSAYCLDDKRLGKQRVEAMQIHKALTIENYGWKHHPATKMWAGHEEDLLMYGLSICEEWKIFRGFKDTLMDYFRERLPEDFIFNDTPPPHFMGEFFLSHQSNLVRKYPEHYRKFFPGVPDNLKYVWPIK